MVNYLLGEEWCVINDGYYFVFKMSFEGSLVVKNVLS